MINDKINTFKQICKKLSRELKRFNIETEASTPNLNLSSFSEKNIAWAIRHIENESNRFSLIPSNKIKTEPDLLNFLETHKFKYSQNILEHISEDKVVEVYSSNFKALYRSPHFYRVSSYAIDQLHLHTWAELFERKQEITDKLSIKFTLAFESPIGSIIELDSKKHIIKERRSRDNLSMLIQPGICAPIELNGNARAVITTHSIQVREVF